MTATSSTTNATKSHLKILIVTMLLVLAVTQLETTNPFLLLQTAGRMETRCQVALNQSDSPPSRKMQTEHPQFVFLMGTEGSGHHLWSHLVDISPNVKTLRDMNLIGEAESIAFQLFHKRDLTNSLFVGAPCVDDWNGTRLIELTAQKLQTLSTKLPQNVTVPLNGIPSTKRLSGMMSYPNYKSTEKCAGFRHPDVNLLQKACDTAQVTCHYIVQHRDPVALLHSTTQNRRMHSTGYAISLYTSMLNILQFQMSQVPLEFCWNYNAGRPSARLGTLLGWKHDEFDKVFEESYREPHAVNDSFVPMEHRVSLDSLLVAHEQLKMACGAR